MKRFLRLLMAAYLASVVCCLNACDSRRSLPRTALQSLDSSTQIDVATPQRFVKTVYDVSRIQRAVRWFQRFPDGWQAAWPNSPVPEVLVFVKKDDNQLLTFGLSRGFLTTGPGQLWFRPLAEPEYEEILRILAIKER